MKPTRPIAAPRPDWRYIRVEHQGVGYLQRKFAKLIAEQRKAQQEKQT